MTERRKRGEPDCSMYVRREKRQCKRPCTGQEIPTEVKVVATIVIRLSVATAAIVIEGVAPKMRKNAHGPRCLLLEEHRVNLDRRSLFLRGCTACMKKAPISWRSFCDSSSNATTTTQKRAHLRVPCR